jgi:hypothetical protein
MPASRAASMTILAVVMVACATTPSPSVPGSPAAPAASSSAVPAATGVPNPAPPESPAAVPLELPTGSAPLPAGTYTRTGFRPPITFAIGEGWFPGTVSDGFFDVQQERGTPDVIAVQFALAKRVIGAGGSAVAATTATQAAQAIHDNPAITVIEESPSRLGGLEGHNVVVENEGASTAGIMDVAPGRLSIDPHRRLWISLFDTTDGLLAVMVGGSVARWDDALRLAEPVLESVGIWRLAASSPAS